MTINQMEYPNRLYLYEDGTIGAAWIRGYDGADPWADRGTGYNYFDGTSWGELPSARIEDVKTGWPSMHLWAPMEKLSLRTPRLQD